MQSLCQNLQGDLNVLCRYVNDEREKRKEMSVIIMGRLLGQTGNKPHIFILMSLLTSLLSLKCPTIIL